MRVLAVLILGLVALVPLASAGHTPDTDPSPYDQKWLADGDASMWRDPHAVSNTADVTIPAGTRHVWCADENAGGDYPMGPRTWNATLLVKEATDLRVEVGKCVGSAFIECRGVNIGNSILTAAGLDPLSPVNVYRQLSVSAAEGALPKCIVGPTERLGLVVQAVGGEARIGTDDMTVTRVTAGDPLNPIFQDPRHRTSLAATSNILPPYPTPELGTLLLAGFGLVGIALYVRRR